MSAPGPQQRGPGPCRAGGEAGDGLGCSKVPTRAKPSRPRARAGTRTQSLPGPALPEWPRPPGGPCVLRPPLWFSGEGVLVGGCAGQAAGSRVISLGPWPHAPAPLGAACLPHPSPASADAHRESGDSRARWRVQGEPGPWRGLRPSGAFQQPCLPLSAPAAALRAKYKTRPYMAAGGPGMPLTFEASLQGLQWGPAASQPAGPRQGRAGWR